MAKTGDGFSPFAKQCFVTVAVGFNIIGHGASFGYPAVLLPQLQQPGSSVSLDGDQESWITSVTSVTMLVGNFITPSVMDRMGRRVAHLAVAAPAILGWIVTIMATSFEALLAGRILHGLSFGMLLQLRSVLIGEYTSPKNRGAFLTTVSLAQGSGIFFVHLLGALLSWQQTGVIFMFFHFASFIMVLYSPESPSYLAAKGDHDKCRKVFRWLRGLDEEDELEEMLQRRLDNEEEEVTFKQLLVVMKKRECYIPILIMVHAHAMMHFAGAPTMAAYGTMILVLILGPKADANFWLIFLDGQRIISNCLAIYLINAFKRRTMLVFTAVLCILIHILIALYVYGKNAGVLSYDALWIPLILVNLQFFAVAIGMVPLPYVIAGEVFPLQYRSIGGSISIISVSVFGFAVLKTFTALVDGIGIQGTYLLYAGAMTYFLVVMWWLLPETKGKTLQQIEDELRGRPLKPEEAEVRESLHRDKRKMSFISAHSMVVET